jgi:cell fate regulator YaaT (PSP1 superfamily)
MGRTAAIIHSLSNYVKQREAFRCHERDTGICLEKIISGVEQMNAARCNICVTRGRTGELAFAAADEGRVLVVEFV